MLQIIFIIHKRHRKHGRSVEQIWNKHYKYLINKKNNKSMLLKIQLYISCLNSGLVACLTAGSDSRLRQSRAFSVGFLCSPHVCKCVLWALCFSSYNLKTCSKINWRCRIFYCVFCEVESCDKTRWLYSYVFTPIHENVYIHVCIFLALLLHSKKNLGFETHFGSAKLACWSCVFVDVVQVL